MNEEKRTTRFLGVDWGEKRIGLALADGGSRLAVPYGVAASLREVISLAEKENVDKVIVGLPVKMSGEKAAPPAFDIFVNRLRKSLRADIVLIDERLTSKAADALPGKRKDKAERDAIAAMLILQAYLDGTRAIN